jgi:hypothetical protein
MNKNRITNYNEPVKLFQQLSEEEEYNNYQKLPAQTTR